MPNASTLAGGTHRFALSHHNDTIAVFGHDTIHSYSGNDSVYQLGQATVFGSFAHAHEDFSAAGKSTMLGGTGPTEFLARPASVMGGMSAEQLSESLGVDSATGGSHANVFNFLSTENGGQHVITNFVSGQDKLNIEGYSLSYLQQHGEITSHGGSTYISLDSGKTTIELKGVGSLHNSDFTTHKP